MRDESLVGDVGWYWLMHVPSIISIAAQTRFVCFQRDKADTLKSFRKNHWGEKFLIHKDSEHYVLELADTQIPFPKYDLSNEKAEEKYYDFYYDNARSFEQDYPWNFGLFDLEDMNSVEGQRKILDFLEIPRGKQVLRPGIKDHASDLLSIRFNELNMDCFKCVICEGTATKQLVSSMQDYQCMLCDKCEWYGIEKAIKDTGKNGFALVGGDDG